MVTLLVVVGGALMIMGIAAAINRPTEQPDLQLRRTSGSHDEASTWVPVMSGDGASDCGASDGGGGCDGGGGGGG